MANIVSTNSIGAYKKMISETNTDDFIETTYFTELNQLVVPQDLKPTCNGVISNFSEHFEVTDLNSENRQFFSNEYAQIRSLLIQTFLKEKFFLNLQYDF